MSWQTLITDWLNFKPDVGEERKHKFISDLEDAINCKVEWREVWKSYRGMFCILGILVRAD